MLSKQRRIIKDNKQNGRVAHLFPQTMCFYFGSGLRKTGKESGSTLRSVVSNQDIFLMLMYQDCYNEDLDTQGGLVRRLHPSP